MRELIEKIKWAIFGAIATQLINLSWDFKRFVRMKKEIDANIQEEKQSKGSDNG